uniref:RNA1 polyprotein n=1 Tax=Tomato ringspot virus TaxID=12280 RepID=A0A097GWW6_9SECO|nr:polyprotein [Tomato ringspot virus]
MFSSFCDGSHARLPSKAAFRRLIADGDLDREGRYPCGCLAQYFVQSAPAPKAQEAVAPRKVGVVGRSADLQGAVAPLKKQRCDVVVAVAGPPPLELVYPARVGQHRLDQPSTGPLAVPAAKQTSAATGVVLSVREAALTAPWLLRSCKSEVSSIPPPLSQRQQFAAIKRRLTLKGQQIIREHIRARKAAKYAAFAAAKRAAALAAQKAAAEASRLAAQRAAVAKFLRDRQLASFPPPPSPSAAQLAAEAELASKAESLRRLKAFRKASRVRPALNNSIPSPPLKRQREAALLERLRIATPSRSSVATKRQRSMEVAPLATQVMVGKCTSHQEAYDSCRAVLLEEWPESRMLFGPLKFVEGWKHVPGMLMQYRLAVVFCMVRDVMPALSLVADTLHALRSGLNPMVVFKNALNTANQILECAHCSHAAQGFGAFLSRSKDAAINLAAGLASKVSSAVVSTATKIVDKASEVVVDKLFVPFVHLLRGHFDDTIGKWIPKLLGAAQKIEELWRWSLEWAQNMSTKIDVALRALRGSAFVGMGLLLVAGILYFAEQLLRSFGLMLVAGSFISMFVGGVLLAYSGSMAGIFDEQMMRVRGILCEIPMLLYVKAQPVPFFPKHRGAPTQGINDVFGVPLSIMNALGDGLVHHSLDTLQMMGKFGAAMDNVRKGITCMRSFVSWLMEHLALALDKITGKRTAFFRELATLINFDVEKWVRDSQQYLLTAEIYADGDAIIMDTCRHLLDKGTKLQRMMVSSKSGTSFNYVRLVSDLVKRLGDLHKRYQVTGRRVHYRLAPFWVYLYGGPGCGKSIFAQSFMNAAVDFMGTTVDNCYFKNARDDFWSGYRQEAICCVDDLSACETQPSIESEFIQLITTMRYGLNMAGVEEKGAQFDSKMVITTSNFFTAPTTAKIADMSAYNRRRHACVLVQKKKGVEYDPSNPSAAAEAMFVDSHTQHPLSEWMSMSELSAELILKYQQHREKQYAEYKYWKSTTCVSHDVFDILRKCVDGDTSWLSLPVDVIPPSIRQKYKGNRVFAIDGRLFIFDYLTLECEEVFERENLDVRHLESRILEKYGDTRLLLEKWGANGIVAQFIEQLVEGPSNVTSMEALSKESLASHKEFFSTLGVIERATLRAVQKKIDIAREDLSSFSGIKPGRSLAELFVEAYDWTYAHGGKLLLVLAAVILILFFGSACVKLMQSLFAGATGGTVCMATVGKLSVQSTIPSGSYADVYNARNMTRVFRPQSVQSSKLAEDQFNESHAVNMLVRIDLPDGNIISACRFRGKSLALTKHQAMTIPPGAKLHIVYTDNNGNTTAPITHFFQPTGPKGEQFLRFFNGTEVCIYSHPQLSALPGAPQNYFLKDVEKLSGDIAIKGCGIKLGRTSVGVGDSVKDNEPVLNHWRAVARVRTTMLTIDNYAEGGDYCNSLPTSLISEYVNSPEDCGALIVAHLEGGYKIIGMHVAGSSYPVEVDGVRVNRYISHASFFPDYASFAPCQSNCIKSLVREAGVEERGVSKVGHIKDPAETPHVGGKTKLELVDEAFLVPSPVEVKIPSILSKDDPRIPETYKGYDPLGDAMEKFYEPMLDLDEDVLNCVMEDMHDVFYDCQPSLRLMSDDEVINGSDFGFNIEAVVRGTSEGYPFVLSRRPGEKGKARYLEELEPSPGDAKPKYKLVEGTDVHQAMLAMEAQARTEVPLLIGMDVPKDERLKPSKVLEKPKTRTFVVLPMHYNLLLRKYVGILCSFMQVNRHRLSCAVGTNPYSRDWTDIYQRLAEKNSVAMNCDYSRFDGLLNYQAYVHIVNFINRLYNDEHTIVRGNLLMAMYGRWSICGQRVFEVRAGMPSGCALTVIINSLFNEMLIRYVYRVTVPRPLVNNFNQEVCLIVYGDDNLISVKPDTMKYFNGDRIKEVLAKFKVTITDGSDKNSPVLRAKPLKQLDFLKRGFKVQSDGRVLAPLDLQAIFSSLYYINPQGNTLNSLFLNAQVALRELYLHNDIEQFTAVRNFYVTQIGGNFLNLPQWRHCAAFHDEQYSQWKPWAPVKFLEVDVPDVKFLQHKAPSTALSIVADRLAVAGPGWRNKDPDKYLLVSLTSLKANEGGLYFPVDYGEGVGQQATEASIFAYRKYKDHRVRHMRDSWNEGKTIVFRCEGPFVSGWAAAISFGTTVGMNAQDLLRNYDIQGGRHREYLGRYFENVRFKELKQYARPYNARLIAS